MRGGHKKYLFILHMYVCNVLYGKKNKNHAGFRF